VVNELNLPIHKDNQEDLVIGNNEADDE